MAITPCAPCSCIPGNIPNDKFKQDVEILLCAIAAAVSPDSPTNHEIVPFTGASIDAAAFTSAAYLSVVTTTKVSFLEVNNQTSRALEISFDGSTIYKYAPSGEITTIYFEPVPLVVTAVYLRGLGGTNPTEGQAFVSGYYDDITV